MIYGTLIWDQVKKLNLDFKPVSIIKNFSCYPPLLYREGVEVGKEKVLTMKLKNHILVFILVAGLGSLAVLSSCNQTEKNANGSGRDTLRGKITISGAFALYPLVVKWAEEFQKLHPGVIVNVSAGGGR